ncbi:MAG: hypothetical protein MUO35_03780 [Anaerolineales bacterium]|nr:hypothetical protein [Anaerolineales bacterium]
MGEGIAITTYNGHTLNDATYESKFLREVEPNATFEAAMVATEIAGDFPEYVRGQPGGKVMPLYIRVKTPTLANIRQLKAWMTPLDDEVYLRGTDTDAVVWRLKVKCLQLVPFSQLDGVFVARLYATEPIWENDVEQSDTESPVASGVAWDVTPAGSVRTRPTFEITPTASKDHANGYKRRWQVIIANKVPRTLMDTLGAGYPIDIAYNSLNTDVVSPADLQDDLDDLRVFVDGKNMSGHVGADRWCDPAVADSSTKVWVNISFQPRKTLATIKTAMTAISPANGENIIMSNAGGVSDWPESGFLVVDDECIYYASRTSDTLVNITRGVRNTTAAIHVISSICYWVEHEITIEYDYTAAANPPISADLKPVLDLVNSTNALHIYTGPFIAPTTGRTGQFLADYRDENELSPYMSIQDTGAVLNLIDTASVAGKPKATGMELYVPCGVDTAAGSLEQDVTVPANMLCRAYGTDEEGNESLLTEWNPDTDGADEEITPADELVRVRYAALVRTVTAAEPGTAGNGTLGDGSNEIAQSFTLDQDFMVYGFTFKLKKTAGADGNVIFNLYEGGTADHPDSGNLLLSNTTIVAAADLAVNWAEYVKLIDTRIALAAGNDYYITMKRDAAAAAIYWNFDTCCYAKGTQYTEAADTWTKHADRTMWFRVLGDGSVCQDEVPANSGGTVILDNIEIALDTPVYAFIRGSEEIYSYDAVLENVTTGQSMTISFIGALNEKLTINCETGEVTGGAMVLPVPWAVEWGDEVGRLHLEPGVANSLKWTEASLGTLGVKTLWRGRWS